MLDSSSYNTTFASSWPSSQVDLVLARPSNHGSTPCVDYRERERERKVAMNRLWIVQTRDDNEGRLGRVLRALDPVGAGQVSLLSHGFAGSRTRIRSGVTWVLKCPLRCSLLLKLDFAFLNSFVLSYL